MIRTHPGLTTAAAKQRNTEAASNSSSQQRNEWERTEPANKAALSLRFRSALSPTPAFRIELPTVPLAIRFALSLSVSGRCLFYFQPDHAQLSRALFSHALPFNQPFNFAFNRLSAPSVGLFAALVVCAPRRSVVPLPFHSYSFRSASRALSQDFSQDHSVLLLFLLLLLVSSILLWCAQQVHPTPLADRFPRLAHSHPTFLAYFHCFGLLCFVGVSLLLGPRRRSLCIYFQAFRLPVVFYGICKYVLKVSVPDRVLRILDTR